MGRWSLREDGRLTRCEVPQYGTVSPRAVGRWTGAGGKLMEAGAGGSAAPKPSWHSGRADVPTFAAIDASSKALLRASSR
jgi:hypothetical protein